MSTKTTTIVTTNKLFKKLHPEQEIFGHSSKGITRANYTFNPNDCNTKLGAWLAERILTTEHVDDYSLLFIESKSTDSELSLNELLERLKSTSIRNSDELKQALSRMEDWCQLQRANKIAFGDIMFKKCVITFNWPVLGSRSTGDIETPAAYFDLCAKMIIDMKTLNIRIGGTGESPPSSVWSA
ncbi:MAG: hypothetical protein KKG11_06315 [Gammaproteobacteria bacterium]|nr:hypothetical protein [Gammaproteobacteria bacterium]